MKRIAVIITLLAAFTYCGMVFAQQTAPRTGTPPRTGTDPTVPAQRGMANDTDARVMMPSRASQIIGLNVRGSGDESYGEVNDLVIGRDGKVDYIIVAAGGVLGIGEKMIAVPWNAAKADFGSDFVRLGVDKDRLQKAPSFSSWDRFDQTYGNDVKGYFGDGKR